MHTFHCYYLCMHTHIYAHIGPLNYSVRKIKILGTSLYCLVRTFSSQAIAL